MSPELDEQLCKKYPRIFRDRNGDMRSTAMCWGLAVGDGWYNILDQACALIQWHVSYRRNEVAKIIKKQRKNIALEEWEVNKLLLPYMHQPIAVQVKEKFGSLRFYMNGTDEYTDGILAMAESMSEVTCETCGCPSKISGSGTGWLTSQCERCTAKQ